MSSFLFFYRCGEKEKKYIILQIFNTLKRLQINVGEDVWKRQPTVSMMFIFCASGDFVKGGIFKNYSHRSKMPANIRACLCQILVDRSNFFDM